VGDPPDAGMRVPQFAGKHDHRSVVEPPTDGGETPPAVVVCYQDRLFERVLAENDTEPLRPDRSAFSLHRLADRPAVGVLGEFGIGAPTTVMALENVVAGGTEAVVSAGWAGALTRDVGPEDVVVPDAAVRDEGTSHHYLPPDRTVAPTPGLTAAVAAAAGDAGDADRTVHRGPTWSTDAPYRETDAEVEHYADDGVLTVEMEAAATFALARHRGVEAAAAFVVSDYLSPDGHDRRFEAAVERLPAAFEAAVDGAERFLAD